ncbi:MAG: LON peptidase substrate-binding domain-containing protein [Bacilli bacterium]|nr:LON peptidase substrate-binding domain-containing protein [Bacilli bacterium]
MADKAQTLTLPLLITRALVIFPGNQQLIEAGREFSINAINVARNETNSLVFVTSQNEVDVENPTENDVYRVGTLCHIISNSERDGRQRVRVEVVERVQLENIALDNQRNYYVAKGSVLVLKHVC